MGVKDAYAYLAEKHGYPNSARYVRVLERLMTPQQARITADLPLPLEEIAARQDLPVDTIRAEIDSMFRKGIIFPRDFHTLESPRFARSVGQLHDASLSLRGLALYDDESRRDLYFVWNEFCENEWYQDLVGTMSKLASPSFRVIPAYRAIKDVPGIEPLEDVREILRIQEFISVAACPCRSRATSVGHSCEHSTTPDHVNCISFGRGAEYALARGIGKRLDYNQAMRLVDEIEDDGLVHNVRNDRSVSPPYMCNCCVDCCVIWHPLEVHHVEIGKIWARSRFRALVDQELCTGCQVCVERCMFGAIEMQKVPNSRKLKAEVDAEKCFGCGACVIKCNPVAITMKVVRPLNFIPEAGAGRGH